MQITKNPPEEFDSMEVSGEKRMHNTNSIRISIG